MPKPTLSSLHSWELYSTQLKTEIRQCLEEGKDVEAYRSLAEEIDKLPLSQEKEDLADAFYRIMYSAPNRPDYAYDEPNSLNEIRARRDGYVISKAVPERNVLRDKLIGAWSGRVSGCLLGKPVEGVRTPGIREYFGATGNWPIRRYPSLKDQALEPAGSEATKRLRATGWYGDALSYSPCDDDTNYTVLGAEFIRRHGRDFTPDDVRSDWLNLQPVTAYCTAERVAMRNFHLGYCPPDSAVYKNPYREWIGAQIRADYFGYVNPGDPEAAAEMAWKDASVSHVKNGIYGEMFVASMLAAAAVCSSPEEVIRAGIGQIPKRSRLYEAITKILDKYHENVSFADLMLDLHKRWDEYEPHDWCHTISNAEIVTACLLYAKDFSEAIGSAVEQGFDTDCNGATVGSVFGMLHGSASIGAEWIAPINGTVDTTIVGVGCTTVSGFVDRMLNDLP